MKTLRNCIRLAAFAWLAIVAFASCNHKELCYDHSHMTEFEVKFDWSGCPDAEPRTMVLQLFYPDGNHYNRYEFGSVDGGIIRVHTGTYRMLFHNGDMDHVIEQGTRYEDYEVTTPERDLLATIGRASSEAPRPDGSEDQPVRFAPESVWGGSSETIEIRPSATERQSITLRPQEATDIYTVEIRNVENLEATSEIGAALTGFAECHRFSTGAPAGQPVTIPLDLTRVDNRTLTTSFAPFGHCPEERLEHMLSIYTSNKVYYHFDVTNRIHEAEDPHNVQIVIDGLKLPLPGTGMDTSVSDWDSDIVENDINMN